MGDVSTSTLSGRYSNDVGYGGAGSEQERFWRPDQRTLIIISHPYPGTHVIGILTAPVKID